MKTVVICGGGRGVGKTSLAIALVHILPGARAIKLGVHAPRADGKLPCLPRGTAFREVRERAGDCEFLIVESGAVLDDPSCAPDLVVFLPVQGGDKPGSEARRARADLVRGQPVGSDVAAAVGARLGLDVRALAAMLAAIGTPVLD
ncbi:MAG: hypothetical protein PHU25_20990 [Deltaproteobacteria bacterium]|nr:hypothetical protein [Deltaproteobacteria bacterium]